MLSRACDVTEPAPQGDLADPFRPVPIKLFPIPLTGRVVKKIKPDRPGQVSFGSTTWKAQSTVPLEQPIEKQQTVIIVGRQGNTLLVLPPNS
jgi:hypothetical protein